MPEEDIDSQIEELLKRAQEQPGIAELMAVYGRYEEVVAQSHEYLAGTKPKSIISTTSETS
jgi:hypothetical protein